jgi:hypothetical protein
MGGAGVGSGAPTRTARRWTGGGLFASSIPPRSTPNRAAGYWVLTALSAVRKVRRKSLMRS